MFEDVLVPLDGSPLAECVLPHAVTLSRLFDARITLLRVLETLRPSNRNTYVDPLDWHIRKAEATAYLQDASARLGELGIETKTALLEGQPAGQIIEYAHSKDVSLILLASHGRSGLSGWNISSVVQKAILRAYMPTMIVRAYQTAPPDLEGLHYRNVLVPLDGSQRAECVLPLANVLTRSHESQLILAHVVCTPEVPRRSPLTQEETGLVDQITERNRQEATRYLDQLRSRLSASIETRLVVEREVTAALHDLIEREHVDLVILSAHGYSGGSRWPYGSVALNLIAYGVTPLLIVQDLRPDEVQKTEAEIALREVKGH